MKTRKHVIVFSALSMLLLVLIACQSDTANHADEQQSAAETFALLNPEPEIRAINPLVDLGFNYQDQVHNKIPRDSIVPVYSPEFVTAEQATLKQQELVLGLAINGEAHAYPVGMMRIREIVNDEVGGVPVLVTW